MTVKESKITAEFDGLLKKVDLGSKSSDGVLEPVYKLLIETPRLDKSTMDSVFGIHKKQKKAEVVLGGLAGATLSATLKKVDLHHKMIEGYPEPIYRIHLEAYKLDDATIQLLFTIHKAMKDVFVGLTWVDPQLEMELDDAIELKGGHSLTLNVNDGIPKLTLNHGDGTSEDIPSTTTHFDKDTGEIITYDDALNFFAEEDDEPKEA